MITLDDVHGNNVDGTPTAYTVTVADQVMKKHRVLTRPVEGEELRALLAAAASLVEHDMY